MDISRVSVSTLLVADKVGFDDLDKLPNQVLSIISSYLWANDFATFSAHSPHLRELGYRLIGGKAIWTVLYERDFSASFQKVTSRLRARDDLYTPLTLDEVLAQLYQARIASAWSICRTLRGHIAGVRALVELRDGRIASASKDRTIRIWRKSGGEKTRVLKGHEDWVNALIELRDGRIVSASSDHSIRIWPRDGGEPCVRYKGAAGITAFIKLRNGCIASVSCKEIGIWSQDGEPLRALEKLKWSDILIELSDGRFATASYKHTIRIWPQNGGEPCVLQGTGRVTALLELRDGCIASASDDHTIHIWQDSEESHILKGHTGAVTALIQLRDGRIASASDDHTIRIWKDGEESHILKAHTGAVTALIQLRDGRIASASDDRTIRIWDVTLESLVDLAFQLARQRKKDQPEVDVAHALPASLAQSHRNVQGNRKLFFIAVAIVVMGITLKLISLRNKSP